MRQLLNRTIDVRPLAVGRIFVALGAVLFTIEWLKPMLRVSSGQYLSLPVFDGWAAPPPVMVWSLFAVSIVSALAMILGIGGRIPALLVAAVGATVLLLDQQIYSNHLVLLVMLATFFGLSGASKALTVFSLKDTTLVPYWPAFLIKAQITTLYAWTAISKINPQYLSGEVMAANFRSWVPIPQDLFSVVAVFSIVVEAFLAVALWFPKTRLIAFVCGIGLHVGILLFLLYPAPLIPFAMLMASGYVLFLHDSLERGQWRMLNSVLCPRQQAVRAPAR